MPPQVVNATNATPAITRFRSSYHYLPHHAHAIAFRKYRPSNQDRREADGNLFDRV